MKINWRKIAAAGLITGMVAITGCSSNLPETNQGNRNGQRVADAVNRREDTYRTTSNRLGITENTNSYNRNSYGEGIVGRTTRGIRRAADNVTGVTRGVGRNRYRTNNRSLNLGRPHGRIGNTYRYSNHRGYNQGINNRHYNAYGYDMGIPTSEQAIVDGAVTRNTATVPAIPHRSPINRAATNRATNNNTTEKTETKVIDTKRKAKPNSTKTQNPKPNTTATNPTRSASKAAPKLTINHAAVSPRNYHKSVQVPFQVAPELNINHIAHSTAKNNTRRVRSDANRYGMSLNNKRVAAVNADNNHTIAVANIDDSVVFDQTAFFRKKNDEPTQPTVPEAPAPVAPTRSVSLDDSQFEHELNNFESGINSTISPKPTTEPTVPPNPTTSPRIAPAQRALRIAPTHRLMK